MKLRERRGLSGSLVAIIAVVAIVAIAAITFASVRIVNPGERGVLISYGKIDTCGNNGTLCAPLGEGMHLVTPIQDSVVIMPVRTVLYTISNTTAQSHDAQTITFDVAVNYHLSPDSVPYIYQHIGDEKAVESTIIDPAVRVGLKEGTRIYDAVDLIQQRPQVESSIQQILDDRVAQYDIKIDTVSLTHIQFNDQFNQAVTNKVSAEQDLQRIQIEAQQKVATAEGERNATIAAAQGQATAIRNIEQACGCPYVEYQAVQKWNGILPQVNSGGNLPFILNTPNLGNKTG